jgi:hypothetical protein
MTVAVAPAESKQEGKVPTTDPAAMSCEELLQELMWNTGGTGYGVCAFAGMMLAAMDHPEPNKPDWKSIVAVQGDPRDAAIYTDEELRTLVSYSRANTARYDQMFSWRRGANLIFIWKTTWENNTEWYVKRQSWETGPLRFSTLEEAVAHDM